MRMKTLLLASAVAGLFAGPLLAQTTGSPSGGTTTEPPAAGAATPPTSTAAFDQLSTGNQKIARSLFEAQGSPGSSSSSLSLGEIAAMKSGTGWGQVFKQMQSQGQLEGAKNLGQVVSGHYRPTAPTTGSSTGVIATTGAATIPTASSGTSTATAATVPAATMSSYTRTAPRPVSITTGTGRTVMVAGSSGSGSATAGAVTGGSSHGHGNAASAAGGGVSAHGGSRTVATTTKSHGQGAGKGPVR